MRTSQDIDKLKQRLRDRGIKLPAHYRVVAKVRGIGPKSMATLKAAGLLTFERSNHA